MSMQFIDLKAQYQAIKKDVHARIDAVLEHGQYILGPEVPELEKRLAAFTGSRHCITVASGTEAILIALMALDIGSGDEVITSPFTFAATGEMIALLGAKPVFVDVDPRTCNIRADAIESKITGRTRAIMPVSLYGQVPDMDEINQIARRHGLPVIEDAAQSFGALYKGRRSCALSTFGATSFFPSKPLGCYGDGGALFTDDDRLAQTAREIRVHGQSKRYWHTRIGVGGRMDTIQCAVVLAKMERFEWELERRQQVGRRYHELLGKRFPFHGPERTAELGCQLIPWPDDRRNSVFAQFTVLVRDRDTMQERLKAAGVPTAVHYPIPLNEQPAYARFCCPECTPMASMLGRQVMSLPFSADLTDSDQNVVCDALTKAVMTAS
jgi:UDP-2-acetamido-2-deoxy-ribo-hexuluronate aminotransferase